MTTEIHDPTLPTGVYRFEAMLTPGDVETIQTMVADALRGAAERVRARIEVESSKPDSAWRPDNARVRAWNRALEQACDDILRNHCGQ